MKYRFLVMTIVVLVLAKWVHVVFASGVNFNDTNLSPIVSSSGQTFSNPQLTANVGVATTTPQTILSVLGNVGIGTWTAAGGNLIVRGGNVGIASAWPGQVLDVNGTFRATGYSGSGSGLTNLSSATPVGGSNAVQYSTASLAGNETKLSFNGTNVGVGTTNGQKLLDIRGTTNIWGNLGIGTSFLADAGLVVMNGNVGIGTWITQSNVVMKDVSNSNFSLKNTSGYTIDWGLASSSGNYATFAKGGDTILRSNNGRLLLNTAASAVVFGDGTSERMRFVSNSGNLGIGTVDPANVLTVVGNGVGIGTNKNTNYVITTASSGGLIVEGNVGIATFVPQAKFQVGTSNPVVIDSNGNLGINSLNPTYALDIYGVSPSVRFNGASPATTLFSTSGGTQWRPQLVNSASGSNAYFRWQYIGRDIDINQSSSNIGLDTFYPGNKLTVTGQMGIGTGISSAYISTAAPSGGMIIENNLGLGTVSPQTQLAVLGNVGIGTWTANSGGLIIASNNVGINTTVPGASLEIVGIGTTSATSSLIIRDNNNQLLFRVQNNGNIGIGTTTSPDSMIQLHGNGTSNTIFYTGISQAYSGLLNGSTGFFFVNQGTNYGLNFGTNNAVNMTMTYEGNVGIGTVVPGGSNVGIGTTMSVSGFINSSGTAPTLSTCGTGPSVSGTDTAFRFTGGTGATACTATFASSKSRAPVCVVRPEYATSTKSYTVSTTALTYTDAALGTNKVDVICIGLD